MRRHLLTCSVLALAALSSGQLRKEALILSHQDMVFMRKAAEGGMAEVDMGALAMKRGVSAKVRAFGSDMVTDHTKANNDLKTIARDLRVNLPTRLGGEEAAGLRRLRSLTGQRFDKTYGQMMVEDHQKDVAEFEKEVRKGRNAAVRDFARRTLPILREHLRMSRMLPR